MAISYVGQAVGTTSATLPTHKAGDVILAFAYRDGNTTAPTLPTGWTNIANAGANTNSARLAYRVATAAGTASGTWTNATSVVFQVYRGVALNNPIGGFAAGGAASTSVAYNTFTLTDTGGTSWVVGFSGHRSTDTNLQNAPTGMTARSNVVDATDEAAGHDTNGPVSSWSTQTVSVGGTSSGWRSYTVELRASPTVVTSGFFNPTQQLDDGSGTAWSSPGDILTSNDVRTTCAIPASGTSSGLFLWSYTGLVVPEDAQVLGITVRVEGSVTAGTVDYSYFIPCNSNTFQPNSVTSYGPFLTGSEATHDIGGASDIWGGVDADGGGTFDRNWLPADINAPEFGVYFAFAATGAGATVSLDAVQIAVTYTLTPGVGVASASAGAATTSTMTGSSTATASVSVVAGVSTTSTMSGIAVVTATASAAAGQGSTSTLAGSSTAASIADSAPGVATASTLTSASTAAATPSAAAGQATANTLIGASVASASIDAAAGAATTSTMTGSAGSEATATIVPAAGVVTASAMEGSSFATASFVPAEGTSTTNTLAASTAEAPVNENVGGGGFASVAIQRLPYPEDHQDTEPEEAEETIKAEEPSLQKAPEPRPEAIEALREALTPGTTPTITIDVSGIRADLAALAAERAKAAAEEEELAIVLLLAAQARRSRNLFAPRQ